MCGIVLLEIWSDIYGAIHSGNNEQNEVSRALRKRSRGQEKLLNAEARTILRRWKGRMENEA